MARALPRVHNGVLWLGRETTADAVPVATASWWEWIDAPNAVSFRYESECGTFTARREPRAGIFYWYAYRKVAGRLRKAYLGRGHELTPQRLAAAANELNRDAGSPENHGHGRLPAQLTSFIGRDHERGELVRLLGTSRLLTVTGVGGSGKTRLAIESAASVRDTYADGVWFVDLSRLGNEALVPSAVLSSLGVRERAGRPPTEVLTGWLRKKTVLLILDNSEHLVSACARLADVVLRECLGVTILATSRELLGVEGEVVWRVPPLASSPFDTADSVEQFARCDAVRLFVERARLVEQDFAVTARNASSLASICMGLDGLPLAIELAAARVDTLTVEQIAARLDDRFRLLGSGSRTAVPRHRTLHATVDWSHALLSQAEKRLFRRLAVFAGGWLLEGAEAVSANQAPPRTRAGQGDECIPESVLDTLSGLVAKSLVGTELRDGQRPGRSLPYPAERRYSMLETLRQFGLEQLDKHDENFAVRARHAAYFLALAERASPELTGPRQGEWFDRLEQEHDNLRSALTWMIENGRTEAALRLAASLYRFWWYRGHVDEGRNWFDRALALDEPRIGKSAPIALSARAAALEGAGVLAAMVADYACARRFLQESANIRREISERRLLAWSLENLGMLAMWEGDLDQARPWTEESVAIWRELHEPWGDGLALRSLGLRSMLLGKLSAARRLLESALASFSRANDRNNRAITLLFLVPIALDLHEFQRAHAWLSEASGLLAEIGDRWFAPWVIDWLASIAAAMGQNDLAFRLAGAADAQHDELGAPLPPAFATIRDRWLDRCRIRLGEAAVAAAWKAGHTLTEVESLKLGFSIARHTAVLTVPAKRGPAGQKESGLLTPREREVIVLVARGLGNRMIAAELCISERTAERHVENLRTKLGLTSRTQLAVWAIQQRLSHTLP